MKLEWFTKYIQGIILLHWMILASLLMTEQFIVYLRLKCYCSEWAVSCSWFVILPLLNIDFELRDFGTYVTA